MEAVEPDIMERKPKPKDEGIFANGLGIRIVLQGMMFAALTLIGFYIGKTVTGVIEGGQTLAFMVLALSQVVHSFNMRSDKSIFKIGPFGNKTLNLAALTSIVLMAVVMFVPVIGNAFGLIMLPGYLYLVGLGLIFVPMIVMEIAKAIGLIKHKNH
ncbi:MAG: cation transporting ATPase C-terminal domain-containing protein, partial [Clostridia bacterium]|nr:cation transporting ATPase C-terminal domain-containing protein [Clostridia bacterium]